jgi:hypothetical protein
VEEDEPDEPEEADGEEEEASVVQEEPEPDVRAGASRGVA